MSRLSLGASVTVPGRISGLFTGAIASEHKQAVNRLRRQNDYMAALHEMTLGIVKRLELDDLLEAIVVRAGALMGTPHGFIYLIDAETDELVLRVGSVLRRRRWGTPIRPRPRWSSSCAEQRLSPRRS